MTLKAVNLILEPNTSQGKMAARLEKDPSRGSGKKENYREEDVKYTIYVRLPFNRPEGFIDPPAVSDHHLGLTHVHR